ncbi:MAG: RNA polymerase sigma factor SigB [uncultured Acidimicrobiales bacterium]|jgi:RNA polymerase sigma-B factor|uniref:RNA polymerase sigma factor SigB n=1 Tax=uncultured Acidimicrobiales bacterium TaxID=310071 RepID=A0A6J4HI69_9ACTN|nr:MAG: RNA polymerase sigma factor SigB [uncultured Acidimicrobiales bacterium]
MALDRADKKALMIVFNDYATTRDSALRDQLIEAHIGLAEYLARRFANRGEPLDDLVQVASLGLVKAVERFDPARGLEFTTFATPTIVGELKRHFRDKGWAVRVPRRVQELHLRITRVIDDLSNELGRSPNVDEIALRAGTTEDEVIEAIDAGSAYRSTSLDAGRSDDDESPGLLGQLGDLDPELARSELRTTLGPLIAALPEREQVMLYLRFYEGLTQSEIAKRLGISQMHVSRLLARSLQQLRELGDPQ